MPNATKPTPGVAADAGLIEIFRAGRHTDMHGREVEVTRQDIADMAAAYDPEKSEAPLVVGHPKLNAPAYGWTRGLVAQGDVLLADPHQVDADFAGMVKAGRFKKRSASFFLPDAKDNPVPGSWYLRHIGFLGAAAPAVKGLKDVQFAGDDEGVVEFAQPFRWWTFAAIADLFRGIRERLIETDGLEKANAVIPSYQIDSIREAAREPDGMSSYAAAQMGAEDIHIEDRTMPDKNDTADFAAKQQKLDADAAALAEREKKLQAREAKAQRDDAVEFADGLVAGGKLLPKDKATVVELLLSLPSDKPLSFASGDETIEKPAADLLRELLDGLPKRLDFSEKSGGGDDSDAGTASFVAPQGALVDAGQLELHRKAVAYQEQHPNVSFAGAYKAVGGH